MDSNEMDTDRNVQIMQAVVQSRDSTMETRQETVAERQRRLAKTMVVYSSSRDN